MNPMAVSVEVWALAADEAGIWLVGPGDALRPALPIAADSEPHDEVVLELARHQISPHDTLLLHSTSWRVAGPGVILTYAAVVRVPTGKMVRNVWPEALPVSMTVHRMVGRPAPHAATDAPDPREIDVLMHALRHLRFLSDNDAEVAAALPAVWRTHLTEWAPALVAMYHDRTVREAA